MQKKSLQYISHGTTPTGGYMHETKLAETLSNALQLPLSEFRYNKNTNGIFSIFKLWLFAFKHASNGINITVQRLLLPVLLKSIVANGKVILVFHHYDVNENKGQLYRLQFMLLKTIVRLNLSKLTIVVVANFWKDFFINEGINPKQIHLFPNFFDTQHYTQFKTTAKTKKQIYLGQYGEKQHPEIFRLAEMLNRDGYHCIFSTLDKTLIQTTNTYEVNYFTTTDYLKMIANCTYTVCLTKFNEGWNRTAHESLLLGVPVIGNCAGGLCELLQQAEQDIVSTAEQAYQIIKSNKEFTLAHNFIANYDIKQIPYYAKPIVSFCNNGIS
ncbi:MAG: hypothetical protein IT246_02770 [Bacteroidia bacterium]|nr:hypothetical protein [Bacteroidia bacterium]